jgi:hypothetical protein
MLAFLISYSNHAVDPVDEQANLHLRHSQEFIQISFRSNTQETIFRDSILAGNFEATAYPPDHP